MSRVSISMNQANLIPKFISSLRAVVKLSGPILQSILVIEVSMGLRNRGPI